MSQPVASPSHLLTRRQQQILDFIRAFLAERGYSPTVREIGSAVGLKSPSNASYQLARLADAAVLTWDPHTPRSIRLTGPTCEHCGGTGRA